MITSLQQLLSNGQAVATTARSTNVIDLGAPGQVLGAPGALVREIGRGRPIPLLVQLAAAAEGTTPTLDVALQMDTVANFASPTTVQAAPQIAGGAAGQRVALFWIPPLITQRYISLLYTVGGTSPVYNIDAGIVLAENFPLLP